MNGQCNASNPASQQPQELEPACRLRSASFWTSLSWLATPSWRKSRKRKKKKKTKDFQEKLILYCKNNGIWHFAYQKAMKTEGFLMVFSSKH